MSVNLMADRYASAFCELAAQQNTLDESVQALERVAERFKPAMQPIFKNPEVSQERRLNVVERVMEGQDAPLIRRFLLLLVEKDRFQYLDEIVDACERKADQLKNRKHARIRSAFPLDDEQRRRLRETLGNRFNANIILDEEQDPDLIGGIQVRIEDYLMDHSMTRQLQRLHRRFTVNAN